MRLSGGAKLSKPLGMDTVIIDDGWQRTTTTAATPTAATGRSRRQNSPDMREFVDRVHAEGMKGYAVGIPYRI